MIRHLVAKEFIAHARVSAGMLAASAGVFVLIVQYMMMEEAPTLLQAATAFCWGVGPMVAAFTARRLFVLEHEQGTVDFLLALPLSPMLLTATKLALGLVMNLLLMIAILWATAFWRAGEEIFTTDWLLRLSLQIGAYTFGWFGVASLTAHFGGYRHGVWLVVLLLFLGVDGLVHEPHRHLFWTAPLADSLESTRYQGAWDAVIIAVGWGVVTFAATVALASYRGGSLVSAWFRPSSTKRSARVLVGVFSVFIVMELVSSANLDAPRLAGPIEGERFAPSSTELSEIAQRAEAALVRIEAHYGLPRMPQVQLRVRHDDRPELVLTQAVAGGALLVALRKQVGLTDGAREVVVDVLMGQSGGLFELVPQVGIWSVGLAAMGFDDPGLARTAARLRRIPPEALESYDAVFARVGRRGAQAAGWLAWESLEELGGRRAVRALARAIFGARRAATGGGLLKARRVNVRAILAAQEVSWSALLARWSEKVAALEPWPGDRVSLPLVEIETRQDRAAQLSFEAPEATLAPRLELWWARARDLETAAVPMGRSFKVNGPQGPAPVLLDPRHRVTATWVLDGEVMGWAEVPVR